MTGHAGNDDPPVAARSVSPGSSSSFRADRPVPPTARIVGPKRSRASCHAKIASSLPASPQRSASDGGVVVVCGEDGFLHAYEP
jgi:hypothetical protein